MRVHSRSSWPNLGNLLCLLLMAGIAGRAAADEAVPPNPPLAWWKGNLHTHSLWSDGNDFPEMIAEWYRTHGYHFLALSDHNVLSEGLRWISQAEVARRAGAAGMENYLARFGPDWVETRGSQAEGNLEVRLKPFSEYRALVEERGAFLLVPSEEISDEAEGVPVHLNATNIDEVIQPLGGVTVREAIANNVRAAEDQARRRGREILVHLNHPNYGFAVTAEDLAAVISERFFEVYNGHPGVAHLGDERRPGVERLWDIANTLRLGELAAPPLYGVATDDSHDYHGNPDGSHPGRGWVMVRARHLTPESIIRAIKRGEFYASSGVTLADVQFDEAAGVLELAIQPDGEARFVTQFIGTPRNYASSGAPADNVQPGETREYSSEVGRVFATVEGLAPRYKLTGDELYVRAVVTSDQPHHDPSFTGQQKQAWTQPVGWQHHVGEGNQRPN